MSYSKSFKGVFGIHNFFVLFLWYDLYRKICFSNRSVKLHAIAFLSYTLSWDKKALARTKWKLSKCQLALLPCNLQIAIDGICVSPMCFLQCNQIASTFYSYVLNSHGIQESLCRNFCFLFFPYNYFLPFWPFKLALNLIRWILNALWKIV